MAKKKTNIKRGSGQSRPPTRPARAKAAGKTPGLLERFQVADLLALMSDHGLTEIDIREGDRSITLKRGAGPAAGTSPSERGGQEPPAPVEIAPTAGASPGVPGAQNEGLIEIKSPMVGTFYASPDPESPPYVSVNSSFGPDTVVCIVEAMKVMNEIKADCSGTIVRRCVENGEAVEFGQPLFLVRPERRSST